MLKSVDPVINSCYFSIFEYYIALGDYIKTAGNFDMVFYNFAHNLGEIYDLTEEGMKLTVDW